MLALTKRASSIKEAEEIVAKQEDFVKLDEPSQDQ